MGLELFFFPFLRISYVKIQLHKSTSIYNLSSHTLCVLLYKIELLYLLSLRTSLLHSQKCSIINFTARERRQLATDFADPESYLEPAPRILPAPYIDPAPAILPSQAIDNTGDVEPAGAIQPAPQIEPAPAILPSNAIKEKNRASPMAKRHGEFNKWTK